MNRRISYYRVGDVLPQTARFVAALIDPQTEEARFYYEEVVHEPVSGGPGPGARSVSDSLEELADELRMPDEDKHGRI